MGLGTDTDTIHTTLHASLQQLQCTPCCFGPQCLGGRNSGFVSPLTIVRANEQHDIKAANLETWPKHRRIDCNRGQSSNVLRLVHAWASQVMWYILNSFLHLIKRHPFSNLLLLFTLSLTLVLLLLRLDRGRSRFVPRLPLVGWQSLRQQFIAERRNVLLHLGHAKVRYRVC